MARTAKPGKQDIDRMAAEYAIGVLEPADRLRFEALMAQDPQARAALVQWQNRLSGLDDAYVPVAPPAVVKKRLDERLFAATSTPASDAAGGWNALALWRAFGSLATVAAVVLAIFAGHLSGEMKRGGDALTAARQEADQARNDLAAYRTDLETYENELAQRADRLAGLEAELASMRDQLGTANGDLAGLRQVLASREAELADARAELTAALERAGPVLVVSLQSRDSDYRFLAVHEQGSGEVRLTRVAGDLAADRDFELWLVEPQKEAVSLGVIPAGKTAVALSPDHVRVLEGGGLLAVSIEQKGGSPTGVAQGPVVAVGVPETL
ncbi:MAG: anti-sigma factor [Nitratireductor sp.]|nr:anti-sigma factor [Nitratireductor sp.]